MSRESDLFRRYAPKSLQRALLRAAMEGCGKAHDDAMRRGKPWMFDALPTCRRLEVETRLQDLVLPPGFTVSLNETPSTHYTQIESDKLVITAVTRSESVEWVPPYRYRETLATSPQIDWLQPYTPADNARLYALLIYGGRHGVKYPTVVEIGFPTPTGALAPGKIDLSIEFPDIVQMYVPPKTEANEPMVALRRQKKDGSA